MTRIFALSLVPVLTLLTTCSAFETTIGGVYLDLSLSGNVQSNGTSIDVENTLGVKGDTTVGGFLRMDGEKHHLWFRYMSMDYRGDTNLAVPIQFQGQLFIANTRVTSAFEYDHFELQYHYDLFNRARFSISPLFKVDLYDAKVQIQDSTNNLNERYSQNIPVPTLGLNVRFDPNEYFHLYGQVNGIAYDDNSFVEYQAVLGVTPLQYISLEVGYLKRSIKYDDTSDIIDIEEDGWFAGVAFTYAF
ncbi:MAG: hypothetical protein O3B01_02160 [Planctomycetota bacterium]|nr:hypothetical protein [Planctomycetota bacterium]MDA1137362.1 hypothetical protein [Planctomycetota bacterium]